jgi:hypothetical protein
MLDGEGMIEPGEAEDHIVHWKIHVQEMQNIGFKMNTAPEIQQVMKDHLTATEMLMMDQAAKNPAYGQLLLTLPQFPIFFTPPPPPIPEIPVVETNSGIPTEPQGG